ncbi:thiol-disulfide oxidoreductase DCC family protein [Flavobacterium sp.]|jgi:predicted DCC family thiol-disulfide oxidoreductase YuxK|uniref:thiol-disulfide oxidoreductase DCC family protein n=1 Tax=Flavobacterium sp. TaxID=239 RepID=UPI0037BE4388
MNDNIIIYDGDCFLCNSFIDRVIKNDNNLFKIIDQRSKLYVAYKSKYLLSSTFDTIYFLKDDILLYEKSDAIIQILLRCKSKYRFIAKLIQLIPKQVRDFLYLKVSKNRFLFGKKDSCAIPNSNIINRTL